MKGIITVVGKDRVGIIAEVCNSLAKNSINILDITQTILKGYFNMMMIVDLSNASISFDNIVDELKLVGKEMNVDITLQHEDIFNSMHRI